ncbi:MAG: pyridoxamine kinase [Oscillospiraceae bacterium]|nr:pyridoxamine kinase [Oscillospiraceae bacterium]
MNIKVAAIHDLSGVGRCSLTVILPTLSAMGIQVCPVPTAILSSHTGGFGEVEMRDLTDYIVPALAHYKRLGYSFDCIYSGFLASKDQVDHCLDFFAAYPDALKVVDPVMADHGKPYKTCTPELRHRMKELAAAADMITPNLTEAAILLGEDPSYMPKNRAEVKSMLARLSHLGPSTVVITSVYTGGESYNAGYDSKSNKYWCVPFRRVNASYPGTGDVFASVLTGSVLKGDSLPIAMNRASEFLELAIMTTFSYDTDVRDGIMLESCLEYLTSHKQMSGYELL